MCVFLVYVLGYTVRAFPFLTYFGINLKRKSEANTLLQIHSLSSCCAKSMIVTVIGLPPELRYSVLEWNSMTHGSITFVIVLLSTRSVLAHSFLQTRFIFFGVLIFVDCCCSIDLKRLAWFAGVGRERYYYG